MTRRALLGRLAALGWFARHGEVAATQALAVLLEERLLREATLSLVGQRAGVDLGAVVTFRAEGVLEDGCRPDLEGRDRDGLPLVMIEAKFAARLTSEQVTTYLNDQTRRLGGQQAGVVAVVVPQHRVEEARAVCAEVRPHGRDGREGCPAGSIVVIDWDTLLDRLDAAVAGLPVAADSIAADLVQLRELCLTLGGLYLRPLGPSVRGPEWRDRADDLSVLVDEVTRRLHTEGRILPIQHEVGYDPSRYVLSRHPVPGWYFSVGVSSRFADEGETPLWLRYHRETPHFRLVLDAVLASDLRGVARTDDGHLWLPLTLSPDLAGEGLVEDLMVQVQHIEGVLDGVCRTLR